MNCRLRLSAQGLRRHPGRTALSAAGMAVGVAALMILLAVGAGAEHAFQEALEHMGKDLLVVSAGRVDNDGRRGGGRVVETLTLADWRAVEHAPGVLRAAPVTLASAEVRHGSHSVESTILGTSSEFRLAKNQLVAAGRFLEPSDVANASRVAVIGDHVVSEIFSGEQPLGARLQIAGMPFRIVGVLAAKGIDPTGADEDNRVIIPVVTAQRRLRNIDFLDRLFIQANSRQELPIASDRIHEILRHRHGMTAPEDVEDFTIRTQEALLETLDDTDRSFTLLLAALTTLTFALASLGMVAVSLLSVRERHGEIGLRLAVGARPAHVLCQFLTETLMVGVVAAAIGLFVGGVGIILGLSLLQWRLVITWQTMLYPLFLTAILSACCGALPAFKAAGLDPIVALERNS